jgi:hypothetical protein
VPIVVIQRVTNGEIIMPTREEVYGALDSERETIKIVYGMKTLLRLGDNTQSQNFLYLCKII